MTYQDVIRALQARGFSVFSPTRPPLSRPLILGLADEASGIQPKDQKVYIQILNRRPDKNAQAFYQQLTEDLRAGGALLEIWIIGDRDDPTVLRF